LGRRDGLCFSPNARPSVRHDRVSDRVEKIDAEKEARIIKMVFYIGLDVANAAGRPQWNPESRRRIVEAAGN
jgi:hypothetical protein